MSIFSWIYKIIIINDKKDIIFTCLSTYELAKINAINAETTYNKIDANLNYTVGTSEIDKYYYAIEEDTFGNSYSAVVILVSYTFELIPCLSLA